MRADSVVRARLDRDTKDRAAEALRAMGLSVSEAIRLLLRRVAEEQRLPFAVQGPNAATVRAMNELNSGRGQRFENVEELIQDLETEHPADKVT